MDVDPVVAFISGVIIPLIIALLGRESIGRWLVAGQRREDTALNALIGLIKESVAGWREATTSVSLLTVSIDRHDNSSVARSEKVYAALKHQQERLAEMDDRLTSLVHILAGEEG